MNTKYRLQRKVTAFLLVMAMLCGSMGLNGLGIPVNIAYAESGSPSGGSVYDISADVENIISGIRDAGDVHASSYYTDDWVLGMAAAGLPLTADEKTKYLSNVLNIAAAGSAAAKAKSAIALTALNIDARYIANKNGGENINLINEIAFFNDPIDPIYGAPFILSLYDLHNYEIPTGAAITRESLIDNIINAQEPEGSWTDDWGSDATGMALPSLAPYYNANTETNGISAPSCAAITTAINDALNYLSALQGIDGGFPGFMGMPDSNTMSTNIVGINALRLNPHTDTRFIKNGNSAMQKLLSYRTSDDKLGWMDNMAANDYACQQGLGALATYQNLSNARSSNLYQFTKETTPYTSWPDANLLTGIRVTAPTQTEYSYDAAKTNDTVNTEGMTVTAVYNGDAANTTGVAITNCVVSNIDRAKPGTQAVTVSYQGYTANFIVTVKNSDTTVPLKDTANVKVRTNNSTIASSASMLIEAGKTSALDVLKMLLDAEGINYVIKQNGYVSEINGLGEFDQGSNSGWLYSVNGTPPSTTSAKDYILQNGDSIVWYYTLDFTKDKSSSNWKEEKTDAESAAGTAKETAAITVTSRIDSSGKAFASVSAKEVTIAIDAALQGAATGVRVMAHMTVEGADNAASVEMTIPGSVLKAFNTKTDGVTIKMPVAAISLDTGTLNTLAAEAGGDIKITVAKLDSADIQNLSEEVKAEIGGRPVYDFSIMSGGRNISEFDGKITLTVPYTASPQEISDGLVIYFLKDDGSLKVVRDCIYDADTGTMTFTTKHFSKYALGYNALGFNDTESHWAKNDIAYLASRGIVNGTSETTFSPDYNVTRAQFVQILANLTGSDTDSIQSGKGTSFIDVPKTAWYSKAVEWAAEEEIVKGIENNDGCISFRPNTNISRQDMSILILRFTEKYEGYDIAKIREASVFSDEDEIAAYAKEAVLQLQQAGLINGKTASTFEPKDYATRAESAKMIAMMLRNSLKATTVVVENDELQTKHIDVSNDIGRASRYLVKTVSNPMISAVGGEWTILGLARSGVETPEDYYERYYENVVSELKLKSGNLTKVKYSEYSRLILALTAIGRDVTNVGGYNLTEKLSDYNNVIKQGINGPIFALLALDSGDYEIPQAASVTVQTTRELLIDYILKKEITDAAGVKGGFSLSDGTPDADITGMSLQALAKYKSMPEVKAAIDRGLEALNRMQSADGSFKTAGTENSESIVQAIVAKSMLGVDAANNVDALMKYCNKDGSIRHTIAGGADLMATEQGLYALAAYERYINSKNSLYDMADSQTVSEDM
ncbi:MAG: S-layer homology domain-containing protein [Eubacteriales bacterium]|nr:S-layer homology domain-containing protein [Eubacteriales bacterium]MDD3199035.1 S-layer homology domain-containing protein [Eubacteriales bacterium]MDD4629479.1 S-layer homology domain-containing protein [Eubacteriales bacterium]